MDTDVQSRHFTIYLLVAILIFAITPKTESQNLTISINSELTYCLLPNFSENITQNFINTVTTNATTSGLFAEARKAFFISYDQEFLDIIGPNPSPKLIEQRNYSFANEAGIWVPDRDEVWFTSSTLPDGTTEISVLDLNTSQVYTPNTSIPVVNPNGGYYFNGMVYFAADGTATVPPAIYAVNPSDGQTSIIINTYFGVRFNGPNDMAWVKRSNQSYLFFTDDPLSYEYDGGEIPMIVDAVWRYDPQEESIVPVISRADILVPNGLTVSADQKKIYVTDTLPIDTERAGANSSGSNSIYSFDLDDDLFAINKRLIGIARTGVPDGIKVDDLGRVWTAETEGIVVRNRKGKVLGVFNGETFLADQSVPIANFAIAGDILVVEASKRLWTLKLAYRMINPERYFTDS